MKKIIKNNIIIIPAIDLKNGKCVRLTKGKFNTSKIYNEDPVEQAKIFESLGCKKIHIVDLDAAITKNKTNIKTIKKIINNISLPIQLGGGIRNYDQIKYWLDYGINNIIVGSMATKNPDKLIEICKEFPKKIFVGVDIKNDFVVTSGWLKNTKTSSKNITNYYEKSKIKGFIYTDVNRDGTLKGLDISKIKKFIKNTKHKVIVGGGLCNKKDIKKIFQLSKNNDNKINGIIIGKAYYSGLINLKDVMDMTNYA